MGLFKKKKSADDEFRRVDSQETKAEQEEEIVEEKVLTEQKEIPKQEEQKVVQVPVPLTRENIDLMVYENNQILRSILKEMKEE